MAYSSFELGALSFSGVRETRLDFEPCHASR
jgi:hypothetical protein